MTNDDISCFLVFSVIYVTAVVVFPSSKFVYHCENIYLFKQSRQTQCNKFKHLSKVGYRQEKGGRKCSVLMQVNSSGGKAGEFKFGVSFCVVKNEHELKSCRLCRPAACKTSLFLGYS